MYDKNVKICPKCKEEDCRVYETRESPEGILFRMRECRKCGHKWKTAEVMWDIVYKI